MLSKRMEKMDPAKPRVRGESPSATISAEIVGLLKAFTGRGPTRAKTHLHDDCVLVVMREAHTVSEGSMATAGLQREVAQARVDLAEDQRQKFIEVVEQATGRRVISFLTSSHQDPSILVAVFVLEPALQGLEDDPDEPQS
jgi:uncharacterized protein YbcI